MKLPEIIDAETMEDQPDVIQTEQSEPVTEAEAEQGRFYYLAAVKIVYLRDAKPKEKTVNVLLDLAYPHINQKTLNDINRAACGRIMKEANVEGENIREAIVMNISFLGHMTPEIFRDQNTLSTSLDDVKE